MAEKPNFLIIYPDTLGANAVGCYGNKIVKTPNIDKLAATGIQFTNCTSANPICCPSRMSLHTGKYVSTHRLIDNGIGYYPSDHLTIPQFLKEQGYERAYYGKTHSINKPDWDDVYDLYKNYNHYLKARGIDITYPERPPLKDLGHGTSKIPSKDWATNILGNLGSSYIKEKKHSENPFLLFMSFEAPHGPVTYPFDEPEIYDSDDVILPKAPERALDSKPSERKLYMQARGKLAKNDELLKFALSRYYSMVTLMDKNVGKLVQALDETGLRENTIIIFLSDHGDFMGNYNCVGKGMSVDQSLIHVPLVLNCPTRFSPHSIDSLVESIDVFPTIAELTATKPPKGLQGESLVPLALGNIKHQEKEFAFSEEFYGTGPHFFSVRNKKYKYILSSAGNEELYDLENDPWEWNDLSENNDLKDLLDQLKNAMLQWRFKCVDQTYTRKNNFIKYLLEGQTDKLPPYLGGPDKNHHLKDKLV